MAVDYFFLQTPQQEFILKIPACVTKVGGGLQHCHKQGPPIADHIAACASVLGVLIASKHASLSYRCLHSTPSSDFDSPSFVPWQILRTYDEDHEFQHHHIPRGVGNVVREREIHGQALFQLSKVCGQREHQWAPVRREGIFDLLAGDKQPAVDG